MDTTTTNADQLNNGATAMSGQPLQHERLEAIIMKGETPLDQSSLRAIVIVCSQQGERMWNVYEQRAGIRIRHFVPALHAAWKAIHGR
jgi:hypothetical protein